MKRETFTNILGGTENLIGGYDGHACSVPGCDVAFSAESPYGYFRLKYGNMNPAQLSPPTDWAQCALNGHASRWMFLAKINGQLKWACPEPDCKFSRN